MKGIIEKIFSKERKHYCFECGKKTPHRKKYKEVKIVRCHYKFWTKKPYRSKIPYELHLKNDVYCCAVCGNEYYMNSKRRRYKVGSLRYRIVANFLEREEKSGRARIIKGFPRRKYRKMRLR